LTSRAGYGVMQWSVIVALVGFARRWITRDGPWRRYLTDAIFPYYIIHQTVIIVVAHHLQALRLPLGAEMSLLAVVTLAACVATYELVRRIDVLRPLFGLKTPSQVRQPSRR
jgi:surface polysaccharide O-acyltransferase-like enzyme